MHELKVTEIKTSGRRIWITKNPDEQACVIYELPDDGQAWRTSNFVLEFGRQLKIQPQSGGLPAESITACVVTHRTTEDHLKKLFCKVSVNELLEKKPESPLEIIGIFRDMVSLFKTGQLSNEEIRGVWGELVAILSSADQQCLCESWNRSITAQYDFSHNTNHLEIKTTSNTEKTPTLSLRQCSVPTGNSCALVLIPAIEDQSGKTIHELYEEIIELILPTSDIAKKFTRMYVAKIKADFSNATLHRFDYTGAISSKSYFDMNHVPRPGSIPSEVVSLNFKVDLEGVERWDDRPVSALYQ